jgi:phosphoglycerate dehydrogenase-like enzyme
MAIGKVVVLTRGGMDKETKDIFMSTVPQGWRPTWSDLNDGEVKVAKELEDAEYVIVSGSPVTQGLLENAKKLKLLETGAQDVGALPMKYALERGLIVANGGGANTIPVAEHTVTLMMMVLKRVLQFNKTLSEGKWRGTLSRIGSFELYDKTVGIIGLGNVGRRVAELCYSMGCNILYYERFFVPYALRADFKGKPVSLEDLLKLSDIVSVHVPSFTANRTLIGWEQLNMMKPAAYLINTSRGVNIDEKALIRALNEHKIAGAALDVWDPEPPNPDNPLLNMPNVIATPHIADTAMEVTPRRFDIMWRNILLVSEGKEPVSRVREF